MDHEQAICGGVCLLSALAGHSSENVNYGGGKVPLQNKCCTKCKDGGCSLQGVCVQLLFCSSRACTGTQLISIDEDKFSKIRGNHVGKADQIFHKGELHDTRSRNKFHVILCQNLSKARVPRSWEEDFQFIPLSILTDASIHFKLDLSISLFWASVDFSQLRLSGASCMFRPEQIPLSPAVTQNVHNCHVTPAQGASYAHYDVQMPYSTGVTYNSQMDSAPASGCPVAPLSSHTFLPVTPTSHTLPASPTFGMIFSPQSQAASNATECSSASAGSGSGMQQLARISEQLASLLIRVGNIEKGHDERIRALELNITMQTEALARFAPGTSNMSARFAPGPSNMSEQESDIDMYQSANLDLDDLDLDEQVVCEFFGDLLASSEQYDPISERCFCVIFFERCSTEFFLRNSTTRPGWLILYELGVRAVAHKEAAYDVVGWLIMCLIKDGGAVRHICCSLYELPPEMKLIVQKMHLGDARDANVVVYVDDTPSGAAMEWRRRAILTEMVAITKKRRVPALEENSAIQRRGRLLTAISEGKMPGLLHMLSTQNAIVAFSRVQRGLRSRAVSGAGNVDASSSRDNTDRTQASRSAVQRSLASEATHLEQQVIAELQSVLHVLPSREIARQSRSPFGAAVPGNPPTPEQAEDFMHASATVLSPSSQSAVSSETEQTTAKGALELKGSSNEQNREVAGLELQEEVRLSLSELEIDRKQMEAIEMIHSEIDAVAPTSLARYLSLDALEEYVCSKDVQFVKASFLLKLAAQPHPFFPRRQDLPSDAKADEEMMRSCLNELKAWRDIKKSVSTTNAMLLSQWMRFPPIVVISYAWLSMRHPDPEGRQLKEVLAPVIEWYMSERARLIQGFDALKTSSSTMQADLRIKKPFTPHGIDFVIFLDYCSLWQHPHQDEEHCSFVRALRGMDILYAHQETTVWRLTRLLDGYTDCEPYSSRGWPFFESAVSDFIKPSGLCLDLGSATAAKAIPTFEGKLRQPEELAAQGQYCDRSDVGMMLKALRCGQRAPIVPSQFQMKVRTKRVADPSDIDVLIRLHEKVAHSVLSQSTELIFIDRDWSDEDAMDLHHGLPLCSSLRRLDLTGNRFSPMGCALIADAISQLPIEELMVGWNSFRDEGAIEIVKKLPQTLKSLRMGSNHIGNEGAVAIAQSLPPSLTTLRLGDNCISVEGVRALADKLPRKLHSNRLGVEGVKILLPRLPPTLTDLWLSDNSIGNEGLMAIANAMPRAIKVLVMLGNSIGDEGVYLLAERIPSTLMDLRLGRNCISDAGVEALLTRLPQSVTFLDLKDNRVSEEGALALRAATRAEALTRSGLTLNL